MICTGTGVEPIKPIKLRLLPLLLGRGKLRLLPLLLLLLSACPPEVRPRHSLKAGGRRKGVPGHVCVGAGVQPEWGNIWLGGGVQGHWAWKHKSGEQAIPFYAFIHVSMCVYMCIYPYVVDR